MLAPVQELRTSAGRALHDGSIAAERVAAWLGTQADWFGKAWQPLEDAPANRRLGLVPGEGGTLVAKGEVLPPLQDLIQRVLRRGTRSEAVFGRARALLRAELWTPAPVACLLRRGQAVLVTRFVDAPRLFHGPGGLDLEDTLDLLAREVARLHASGFRHRDLKASNLRIDPGGAEPRLYWTDLDSLHICPDPPLRTRARDLARLYVSFLSPAAGQHGADGSAFEELVERYLTFSVEPRSQAGEYLRRIRAWSERRLERNRRLGRPTT